MTFTARGSYVAIPTPFTANGDEVDHEALAEIVRRHAAARTRGLVVAGTTGEAATLRGDEFRTSIETVREAAERHRSLGELEVVAGIGTNCTRTSVERARLATELGVDALLAVTPYYNKPSERGLFLHFAAIAEATALPIVLYNVPSRTGVDLRPEIAAELRERFDHVVAIKQAARSIERVKKLVAIDGLAVLCGEDSLLPDFVRAGATGSVGVASNLLPTEFAEWIEAPNDAAYAERILPLVHALFVESNPVPVKAAMAELGLCRDDVRLPLAPLEDESRRAVTNALESAGLLTAEV